MVSWADPAFGGDALAGPTVALSGVTVERGGVPVLRSVDLTVGRGEFVAVLGPNGAGKSTLIQAILGGLATVAGTVAVLGRPAGEDNSRIGYLPQRRTFDAGLRVRGVDIVRLGLDGDRWGFPLPGRGSTRSRRRADLRRVDDVIDLVGARSYAERPIGQLSGGEQQRLLIAQALVRRPGLLLLDEPLDSLDLPNQAGVAALVAQVCRDEGVTVLLVAHDVNPILSYLDRVVYLAHGEAVAGTPTEVITSEILTRLYDTPVEVLRTSDGRLVVVGEPEAPAHHVDRHDHDHGHGHGHGG